MNALPDGPGRRLLALVLLGTLWAAPARAERPDRPDRPDHMEGTADELAGWEALDQARWIAARELGEKVLRDNPSSYAGEFILGMALHRGEGDLARATFHLDRARKGYESRWPVAAALSGARDADLGPWRWHQATL